MHRSFAFRITVWRFSIAILAMYALVLQSVLAPAAPLQLDAQGQTIVLCSGQTAQASGTAPNPEPPGPLSHHSCLCVFHCAAVGGFLPAAAPVIRGSRQIPVRPAAFAKTPFGQDNFRQRPQARAPPLWTITTI
jgi:hypothetical protein